MECSLSRVPQGGHRGSSTDNLEIADRGFPSMRCQVPSPRRLRRPIWQGHHRQNPSGLREYLSLRLVH